jgi:hypothetical protein
MSRNQVHGSQNNSNDDGNQHQQVQQQIQQNQNQQVQNIPPSVSVKGAPELFLSLFQQKRQQALLSRQQAARPTTICLSAVHRTEQSALNVITQMWANSTWITRAQIWERLQDFCTRQNLDPQRDLDYAIMLWAESTRFTTVESSRLKYASDLSAVASRLGVQVPVTRMYIAGLRAAGGMIPQDQAPPITFDQMVTLRQAALQERNGAQLYAALFLAWKTASRWDEISKIVGASFVRLSEEEVIVEWLNRTKTTRTDPFRIDSFTTVKHDPEIPAAVLATLRGLGPEEFLVTRTTAWLDAWMARILRPAPGKKQATAHSIKRGAMDFLAMAVDNGFLDRSVLSIMAKHKVESDIASTTLRYISNKVAKAHMNDTSKATMLLPW